MKCPNCEAKISLKPHLVKDYQCKTCGGVLVPRLWVRIFTAVMAIAVGKTVFSGHYALALILTFAYFSLTIGTGARAFEARFHNE